MAPPAPNRHVFGLELLDALTHGTAKAVSATVWRISWKTRSPLVGSPSGRWNAPGSFDTLYASYEPDGAIAEVYHHLSLAPVRSSAEKLLYPLTVKTRNTLVLDTPAKLAPFGLGPHMLALTDIAVSQELGAAAQLLEYDGLIVPSARWDCLNLVLFPELMPPDRITLGKPKPVNWPAWREKNGKKLEALWDRQRKARGAT